MSDNLKKIGDMKDEPENANRDTTSSSVPKMKESQEDDDPKCKVCKQSLKESAEVMKTLPGMYGNKVSGACAFCLFGLR